MTGLRPDFVEHASIGAIRTQYERAQAQADLWADRSRDLFLLLCQREDQTTEKDAKKRVTALHTPVRHMGHTWCGECSLRRRTGPHTDEWVAYIPHPCPTLDTLENKEPTE